MSGAIGLKGITSELSSADEIINVIASMASAPGNTLPSIEEKDELPLESPAGGRAR